jgi:hypothetical protein
MTSREKTAPSAPISIVPLAGPVPHGLAPKTADARGPHLVNHGGRVIGSVEVVPIYWGAAWASGANAQLTAQLDGFFDFVVTSSVVDLLNEYSTPSIAIKHGRRLTSVHASDSEPGTVTPTGRQVTDEQIQQALLGWIGTGTAPATTANTLYFIYLPPNVVSIQPNGDVSCKKFCGYHSNTGNVYYAVIPYATCNGCVFQGGFLDTLTEVSTHELCEAITDPTGKTWWDPSTGNEVGDICNRDTVRLGGYLVQTEWSNKQAGCTIAPAAPPPLEPWENPVTRQFMDEWIAQSDRCIKKFYPGAYVDKWGRGCGNFGSAFVTCKNSPDNVPGDWDNYHWMWANNIGQIHYAFSVQEYVTRRLQGESYQALERCV